MGNIPAIADRLSKEPWIDEIIIWVNGQTPPGNYSDKVKLIQSEENVGTWGRFLAAARARNEMIVTQDDDARIDYWPAIWSTIEADPTRIAHALDRGHWLNTNQRFYGRTSVALLGWGSIFRKSWLSAFDPWLDKWGEDDLLKRKADRIFGMLLNRRHASVLAPVCHMAGYNSEEALYRREDHGRKTKEACIRCLELLDV